MRCPELLQGTEMKPAPVVSSWTITKQIHLILVREWDPGMHQEECGQQVEGGSPSPLHCPSEASSGVLCPVLGSPVQER